MLFDVNKKIISELGDELLRELIGRLCEAELFGTRANITYGGNQTAVDDGVDVRINSDVQNGNIGYVPRANVVYQSKAMDMSPSEIKKEMRPKNVLRPKICELAQNDGAYIIVSSKSNVSDKYLDNRKKTMRDCLSDCPEQEKILLDFFDAQRIATWVNSHRSVAVWLLDKLGMPTYGWKGYGNWTNISGDETEPYFFDDALSIKYEGSAISTIDFINDMRIRLSTANRGRSIRIVGLSGVGKTRLIAAFFDKSIGENPLDRHSVFYTDCAKVEGLYSGIDKIKEFAIGGLIILDNCKPEEHNTVRERIARTNFALITVEYDVQDETREDTDVYRVEPSSDELIEKVLIANFPSLHQTTMNTIVSLSGGNFRVCKLLAKEVLGGEIIPRLRDTELFDRLFRQRNDLDQSFKKIAGLLSLVCSVDTETNANGELTIISQITGISHDVLYETAKELERREIAQRRGKYISVLPHALANKLAKTAIEDTRIDKLVEFFSLPYPYRLLRSFSKRLAYLHNEPCVKKLVEVIFSRDELLGDMSNVKSVAVLENLASILPEEALNAIERTVENKGIEFLKAHMHNSMFERVLRSIAYDDLLFDRAANVLIYIAIAMPTGFNPNNYGELPGLFHLVLSGTNASPERKLNFIKSLINTGKHESVLCACTLIENALDVSPTLCGYGTFGTQERDCGLNPTRAEFNKWLNIYLDYAISLCQGDAFVAESTKEAIANKLQGFLRCGYINLVEKLKDVVWLEVYTGIEMFLRYADEEQYSTEYLTKVNAMKDRLEPKTLINTMRIYLLGNIVPEDWNDFNQEIERLGERFFRLTENEHAQIISEIFAKPNYHNHAFHFARGIAKKAPNPKVMWDRFFILCSQAKEPRHAYEFLLGYVNGLSEISSTVCALILDDVIGNPVLKEIYPALQFEVTFDDSEMGRLLNSIKKQEIPSQNYVFAFRKAKLNDKTLLLLLNELSKLKDGVWAVINIVENRMAQGEASLSIKALAHELLIRPGLLQLYNEHFFDVTAGNLIKKSYALPETLKQMKELCVHVANEILEEQPSDMLTYHHTMEALTSVNPTVFLDVFYNEQFLECVDRFSYGFRRNDWRAATLSKISDDVIITWCMQNPDVRNKTVAEIIGFCQETADGIVWKQIALFLIKSTSNPVDVLNAFYFRFTPKSWSDSRAYIMKKYVPLFANLIVHDDKIISQWAIMRKKEFETRILHEKNWEKEIEYDRMGFAE